MNTIGAKRIIDKETGLFIAGEYLYKGYRISNNAGTWEVREAWKQGEPAGEILCTAQYKGLAINAIDDICRMKNTKYYIAYGSNMNVEQMKYRCHGASVVGVSKIDGYELVFRGHKTCAVATIEPREGASVPVVVWRITPSDERQLDIYEGFPNLYVKEDFTISLNGDQITAMAYIMTPGRPKGTPSSRYLKTIMGGYDKFCVHKRLLFDSATNLKCFEQENGDLTVCPRCGKESMRSKLVYNSLSRSADVYVCEHCGMIEALCNTTNHIDDVSEWHMFKQ